MTESMAQWMRWRRNAPCAESTLFAIDVHALGPGFIVDVRTLKGTNALREDRTSPSASKSHANQRQRPSCRALSCQGSRYPHRRRRRNTDTRVPAPACRLTMIGSLPAAQLSCSAYETNSDIHLACWQVPSAFVAVARGVRAGLRRRQAGLLASIEPGLARTWPALLRRDRRGHRQGHCRRIDSTQRLQGERHRDPPGAHLATHRSG